MILGAGFRLGPYEVLEQIGSGGMGDVYRARDVRLGRPVAIKVLTSVLEADAEQVARFRQEPIAASGLNHPNIVTIYDVGDAGALPYIAMELVEGQSLRTVLAAGPLPIPDTLAFGIQIADGLCAAHEAGLVHRDLKPGNIMVTRDRRIKILDFGVAKMERSERVVADATTSAGLTAAGAVVGTAAYMAPEQARGDRVDVRADQFALGIVLYEMVTGQNPFERPGLIQTIAATLTDVPRPVDQVNGEAPPALAWVVSRCLAKRPEDRYSSTRELLGDLQRIGPGGHASKTHAVVAPTRVRKTLDVVAVLPFRNESGDVDSEYLTDGLTETTINALSQTPKLRVMARSTVFRYKGRDVSPQQVGLELGVGAVLVGRADMRGDGLTLHLELVNTTDGAQMWGDQYQLPLAEMATIGQDIARDVAEKLRGRRTRVRPPAEAKKPAVNSDAYQMYLRGRFFWNKRAPDAITKAIENFQQAIKLDDSLAVAYAGLADCYTVLGAGEYGLMSTQNALRPAKMAAERAVALDDRNVEGHASLAFARFAHDWDWSGAERGFLRALEINPSYPMARVWYSVLLTDIGRIDEGLLQARQAVEFDPLSAATGYFQTLALFMSRRFEEAVAECERCLELEPNFVRLYVPLMGAYRRLDRFDEALTSIEKLMTAWGRRPFLISALGATYGEMGRTADARALLDELFLRAQSQYVSPYDIARIYLSLKDFDPMFEWFERAFDERSGWLLQMKVSPQIDPIRDDPRYKDLVRRIGFPD